MMRKRPFVSITIPVYNAEDTIEISLLTLIHQTYPRKEIIVIDDGSTDSTLRILSKLADEYPILHVFSDRHRGITRGRNRGLSEARGELVLIGEADAIYSRDYLEKGVQLLLKNPDVSGVCLTGAPWITRVTFVTKCIEIENRIQHKLLKQGRIPPFYAWLFRKAVFDKTGLFDESLTQAEDKDLFLRVKKDGFSIGLIMGVNWRHRRYRTIIGFMIRNYLGAKTRILFLIKHRKLKELLRSISLLWLTAGALLISPFFREGLYVVFFAFTLALVYKLLQILRVGWDCVERKRILFLVPLFSLLRYLSSAVGYSHGLVLLLSKKFSKRPSVPNET